MWTATIFFGLLVIISLLNEGVSYVIPPHLSSLTSTASSPRPTASLYFSTFNPEEYLSESPYYPPLTDEELRHRKDEMLLIASLNRGDKPAISNFKKHWFSERGPDAEALLLHADFNIGKGPEYWEEAEMIFQDLIRSDPTFLEPKARYAKLLCLQGKWEEASRWSQQVLDSKPHHFVTIETMVAVLTGQGNTVMSELWKSRRLPTPSQVEARTEWVDRALEDAQVILGRMQQRINDRDKEGSNDND
jgi:hypothetical protein